MMTLEQLQRSCHQLDDFATASLVLSKLTSQPNFYTTASLNEDMKAAVDIWFNKIGVAVRGRKFDEAEYEYRKNDITIRDGELAKLFFGGATYIVYLMFTAERKLLGLTVVDVRAIRRWATRNNVDVEKQNWWINFDGMTHHWNAENGFVAIDVRCVNDWIFYKL